MSNQDSDKKPTESLPVPPPTESGGGAVKSPRRTNDEARIAREKIQLHQLTAFAKCMVSMVKPRIDPSALKDGAVTLAEPHQQFTAQLSRLFRESENVTIVRNYKNEGGKVRPDGMGATRNRDEWIKDAESTAKVPDGAGGAWFVVNPTDRGELGDGDVLFHRHLLVENDALPMDLQLEVLQALPLPILSITKSGRRSYHAIVEVNAHSAADYADIVGQILTPLKLLGFDTSCRNPGRLTRLAGATRRADVSGTALQTLVYLRPADAPYEGIGDAIKSLHILIHQVREARIKPAGKQEDYFYDSSTRLYWRRNSRGVWISVDEKSVSRSLAVEHGLSRKSDGGGSEVEHALVRIQRENDVVYAGPLAGYSEGIHMDGNRRLLITQGPTLITPKEGPWPLLGGFFERIFVVDGIDQRPFVFGWLKCAVDALRNGIRRPGQVLVLAGPVGSGKSLFQQLVTAMLGGRSERAYSYFSTQTGFNGDLFSSEHLILEDELASRDMRSRRQFGQSLKAVVANTVQRCRRMRCEGVGLRPFWRVTLSLNDSPEDLLVLPPMDDGFRDKVILLVVNYGPPPKPVKNLEDRAALWSALADELPAFLSHLDSWPIPAEIQNERYGVTQFHHPRILVALRELASEFRFLEIIDAVLFRSGEDDFVVLIRNGKDNFEEVESEAIDLPWQGSALDLERKLLKSDFEREVGNLLSFNNAAGTFLRRLEKEFPDRIRLVTIRGRRYWRIEPPVVPSQGEAAIQEAPMPVLPQPPDDSTGLDLTE
jgi:hypothetical protein